MKKVTVIIPSWNGAGLLKSCLESLEKQTYPNFQVLVVDNGSTDGTQEVIRKFSFTQSLILQENKGFAGGVNAGLKQVLAGDIEFIALFNNDAIADPGWLSELVQAALARPEAGIFTSKILRDPDRNKIDSTGDFYSTWGLPFPRGRDENDAGQYDKAEFVFGATGGASLYRTALLKEVGLFDEDFFAYYEDTDISFRAQLAGWKIWYEPAAVAYHKVGATSSKLGDFARFHTVKNFIYTYTKNMPGWLFWKYLPLAICSLGLMLAHDLFRGQVLVFFKGLGAALGKTLVMLSHRRKIQKNRKSNIEYIDSILFHGMSPTSLTSFRKHLRKNG